MEADELGKVIDATSLLAARVTVIALGAVYVKAETSVTKREALNEVMSAPKVTCVQRVPIGAVNKAAEEKATREGAMQQQIKPAEQLARHRCYIAVRTKNAAERRHLDCS